MLYYSIREQQCLQNVKSVFLEMQNMDGFPNQVAYINTLLLIEFCHYAKGRRVNLRFRLYSIS